MSQVQDALPPPEQCDVCCSPDIEFTTNDRVYGKLFGQWPHIYFCNSCRAAVGCHPNTNIPLGHMADRQTRQLRIKAHDEFDRLWRNGLMTRSKAYNWLAAQLEIEPSQCHISWLNKDQLKDVATLSADYLRLNYNALTRRKVKQDAKQEKRNQRTIDAERRDTERLNAEQQRRRKAKRRFVGAGRS